MVDTILNKIEKELFDLIEQELVEKKYIVEDFVNKYPEEIGKLVFEKVKNESFVKNVLVFSIVIKQVLPHIADEYYIPSLLELIKEDNYDVRVQYQAIQLLGWRKEEAKEAIPFLLKFLGKQTSLQQISAIALSEIGYKQTEELIPYLLSTLKNAKIYNTRMNAARILVKNEKMRSKALPVLIDALEKDTDFRVRQKIARFFGEIENKQVKEALQKAANNDKHPVVRTVANTSLKDLEKLK